MQFTRLYNGLKRLTVVPAMIGIGFFLASTSPSHANSFSFQFSTGQLLNALREANPSSFSSDGYFAVFLQPDLNQVQSFTGYGTLESPVPTGAGQWLATTITDPLLGQGEWAQFSKLENQASVLLASGANGGPSGNIFTTGPNSPYHYHDSLSYPLYFGGSANFALKNLSGLIPTGSMFTLTIISDDAIPGQVTFNGFASAIMSDSTSSFDFYGKTEILRPFSLTMTPEPGTFVLLGIGIAGFALARLRRKR